MKLSPRERLALTAYRDTYPDFGFLSFVSIAQRSGLDRSHVRRSIRSLARKGLAEFSRGLTSDDGDFRGSGYGLTKAGYDELERTLAAGDDKVAALREAAL